MTVKMLNKNIYEWEAQRVCVCYTRTSCASGVHFERVRVCVCLSLCVCVLRVLDIAYA